MSSRKSIGMQQKRKPNPNKKKSSSFNFFRKPNNSGVKTFSEQKDQRPESRYTSLKANNNDLAKALERSHVRESELKDQISQLQDDNLDLIKKLQCLKESEEQGKLQFCYHQRIFLEKLIEAVEVLTNASFCSGESKAQEEMDVVDYGVNRKDTVHLDDKELREHQPIQDSFVTLRERRTGKDDAEAWNDSMFDLNREMQHQSAIDEEVKFGGHGTNAQSDFKNQCDKQPSDSSQCNSCNEGLPDEARSTGRSLVNRSVACWVEQRPELLVNLATSGTDGSLTMDVDIDTVEANGTVSEHSSMNVMKEQKSATSLLLRPIDCEERLGQEWTSGNNILDIIPASSNRRERSFVILDESQTNQGTTNNLFAAQNSPLYSPSCVLGKPVKDKVIRTQSIGDRRDLKRRQLKDKRERKRNNKLRINSSRMNIQRENKSNHGQMLIPLEDKENVDPCRLKSRSVKRSAAERVHIQGGCCSPMAKVVKRLLTPMHTRSPMMRRQSRHKRQVSYVEPSLNKKLRRGDPCTDSTLYNSPHFGHKLRSIGHNLKRSPLADLGGMISEEHID
ncbi:uncharacterized protein LOC135682156 [Rhopilema esculentum]|uniref:uncharacterized protein LOC135682156 n=1 Tax=Rhopilema esculentum TaxID=499914 RepID=UPI0031DECCE6|eukprot:gene13998-4966_t